ncbi:MAG: hypothetical protein ACFHU9_17240 [Fluviicola sp.]
MKKIVNTVFNNCYQGEEMSFRSRQIATFLILLLYGGSIIFISVFA